MNYNLIRKINFFIQVIDFTSYLVLIDLITSETFSFHQEFCVVNYYFMHYFFLNKIFNSKKFKKLKFLNIII